MSAHQQGKIILSGVVNLERRRVVNLLRREVIKTIGARWSIYFGADWIFRAFFPTTTIRLTNFLSGGIYKFSNGLFLEMVKDYSYLKQNYSCCFKIWYENNEIGFIWTKSLELAYENGLNTMVRLDNKVFYVYGLGLILKVIVEALGLNETTIKRLDVCYDTDFDVLSRFKTLYYDESTKFRLRNKIKVNGTGLNDEELIIGSLKSRTKCISIYNKTKEINNSHKEYIRSLHKEIFGLKFIYRVELRLFSRTMEIKDIDIMKLERTDYLETIFNTYFDNLVQFIDENNGEKIEFITLNNSGLKLQRVIKQKVNGGTRQVKGVINFLDRECKTTEFYGVRRIWKELRTILLKKYGIETWYLTKK